MMMTSSLSLAVTEGTVQYEGPGAELPFPCLDQSDPLLLLQLQHRYTAVCLALKHSLRSVPGTIQRRVRTMMSDPNPAVVNELLPRLQGGSSLSCPSAGQTHSQPRV